MKLLYLDCFMGAAGDMLMGALLSLLPEPESFVERMNALLGGRAQLSCARDEKCGISGLHVTVTVNGREEDEHAHEHERHGHHHSHHHTSVGEICSMIDGLEVPDKVKSDAKSVFGLVAEAESCVHGKPVENIHFHELGTLDALADVLGVCLLMNELAPERVCASPVNVGSGLVSCAHGLLPVPAPATERLLRGVPIYSGEVAGELCTPTGAALLRHFVDEFCRLPAMRVEAAGYGTGKKDFPAANVVRALLGEML